MDFTAHNIRLKDGSYTISSDVPDMSQFLWFLSAKRALTLAFSDGLEGKRIVDLGCLEGGYTVEFARLGMQTLGIEVRQNNIDRCEYVRKEVALPNLSFVKDDVFNVAKYGPFDAVFCCGLLYHLDKPREFLKILSGLCKVLIVQTHFSTAQDTNRWNLSPLTENEGIQGRWIAEHNDEIGSDELENARYSSWENKTSFWIQKEYLIDEINRNGFDFVFEQYDCLDKPIVESMLHGVYALDTRGMFVGIKS